MRAMVLPDFKPVPAIRVLKGYMEEHLRPR
jgi:hypothetical protein